MVLFGHSIINLQKLLHATHAFCDAIGLCVNVTKTKFMLVQTHRTQNHLTLIYNEQALEVIDCFEYLGMNV